MLIVSGINLMMEQGPARILNSDTIFRANQSVDFAPPKELDIIENLNKINGYFTENRGQIKEYTVKYYINGKGVWFLDDGVVLEIQEESKVGSRESGSRESINALDRFHPEFEPEIPRSRKSVVLKLNFENSNKVVPRGVGLLPHRSNFFYGNDSSKWCTNVLNYHEIVYYNLYENIDLRYCLTEKGLKYEFIVHPGGDPNDIKLNYQNVNSISMDSFNNLIIRTACGDIIDSELFIYQLQNTNKIKYKIEGKFIMYDLKTYGFEISREYDHDKDLVIDPLMYSTFIGSSGYDEGFSVNVDSNNNTYVTGYTDAFDFPNTTGAYDTSHNGSQDVFVSILNHDGSALLYSTFIGGSSGDYGKDLVIDMNGNAYITGFTYSTDFPYTIGAFDTSLNGFNDVFLIKLNPGGNGVNDLIYSTFIGGSSIEEGYDIAINSIGNAYVTGITSSSDFPVTIGAYDTTYNGGSDVFIAKLNPLGNGINDLIYSTFLGGTSYEVGDGIAVDSTGNAYVTGTATMNFPTTPGAYDTANNGNDDGFITKLNSAGSSLIYSTYIGGSAFEDCNSIAVDLNNNVYVTGSTDSSDFPTTSNVCDTSYNQGDDIFVSKLNPSGSSLSYSTFIGGSSDDWGYDITVDFMGNAYITGCTYSINFPVTPSKAYDTTLYGISDAVVIKLNPSGSLLIYSSYIGGMDNDQGYGMAIDSKCKMYVIGSTMSTDFPNTTGVYDPSYNGGFIDSFLIKIGFNIIPYVIDLNVSKSSIIRTETVYIYSNGTDIEDLESELVPTFKYRDSNHVSWLDEDLGTPTYSNNRWEVSLTPNKNAWVGDYEFCVKFTDKGNQDSEWFYLYDGLKVLNNFPGIEDLTLSKNEAYQNEIIAAWVNGNDIEDPEQNLTVDVEYREPSEFKWNITYLKLLQPKPEYVVDKWMINFTIPFGAPFGYYDFRANITDSDGNYTGWLYANDSLLISNRKPELLNVALSQYIVYRNKSILLYANCNDYETPEAELNYRAEYKYKSDSEWLNLPGVYSIDCWASEFITYIDSKLGDYDFRVNLEDSINESTGWQYLEDSLEVLNNPPMISYALDEIEIGMRAEIINLTPFKSDVEDKNENLSWSVEETQIYEYLESVEIIDPLNNLLKIIPLANVIGEEDIELTLTDKDGGTDIRSNITVHVDSRITEKTPKVTLLSPSDNSIINILSPKLEWEIYNPEGETITFTVFLDENPEPKTVIQSGLTTTYFILANNLENAKTYYWWVLPSWGVTLSKPHNFTIDLNFVIEHDLSLMSERSYISVKQGESATINFTINNEGNVKDTFIIEYSASRLQNFINVNKSNIQLETGKAGIVGLKIDLPLDFELGEYTINVNATSMGNKSISAEVNVIFEVLSRFFIANYDVSIEVTPESISIEQSRSYNVTLIIENTGNIADEYYIKFRSETFTVATVQISDDDGLIFVKAGFIENISVNIMVPEVIEVGAYLITFISNNQKVFDDAELTVNVLEKADSSKPPKDTQVEKKDNFMFYLVMTVIIIIVILILAFLFIRKKKEEKYLNSIKNEDKDDKKAGAKPIEKGQLLPPQKLPVAQPINVETSKGLGGGVPQASPIVLEQQLSQKKKPPEQSYTSTTSTAAHTTPSEPTLARKVEK